MKVEFFIVVIIETRKYPLRGYILGPPGWPESIFSAGVGTNVFFTQSLLKG